ncbi:hypothetical protein [Streptomyces sp. S1D4-20]|uniref:hypothetical protein n=1 Tax=Streptomyces sp. S1D4-20 TaxID=2594462 RepID=UPI001163D17A|nr:hypothetical protein [Streptomyces sp. S1D4-20]QDN54104.1 hypothetical protein FNV67_00550 [Streptomyces sp. S1D4-20]
MSSIPSLREQFLQRLVTLPELITFEQIANVTLRDVDAVQRWQKMPDFPPEADRKGPRGARRFNRDLFGTFYLPKLGAQEAGTAPGPKTADAIGQIPETPGLCLTSVEIAALRRVTVDAVHKAASSDGFPRPTGVRSVWRTVKTFIEGQSDAVPEEVLLEHGVKRRTLKRFASEGMLERTLLETRYQLTSEGRRKSPRLGTQQYVAWQLLKDCYPHSLPIDDIVRAGVSRTNFAAMVARGDAKLAPELAPKVTYRLTAKGRANDPVEEGHGEGEYEYDAVQVARFYRGEHQGENQRLGPLTASDLEQWAQRVGDTCIRVEITQVAGRSNDWVAKGLKREGAPAPLGRRQLKVGRSALEYDTRTIVDWLKKQFSIND